MKLALAENSLLPLAKVKKKAQVVTEQFLQALPKLCLQCNQDAQALYKNDVACESVLSAVIAYPGLYALNVYRCAHIFLNLGAGLLARVMTEYAHRQTAIDIHPGAVIGEECVIDHGHGVVVGKTAIIGDRVTFYHGVTLGARGSTHSHIAKNEPRHPIIEDDVILFANATVLGRVTVGAKSVIGASVLIRQDVPEKSGR
ncbi:serine O-acetyltransferase EpsC [Piscirickettsia litoralis]|uniref:Serine acetyltransferase n=1 Tax=Piscirickettsia litoralis TaxID=1891921 RepID=A0ABX3A3R4_9GAMM|nr:serine O-acetyltransferase EpsC [Piscirickettsia litoralis]ODN42291.1 hypothetical protein BGC07_04270 [Piscirickettsia litoralis]